MTASALQSSEQINTLIRNVSNLTAKVDELIKAASTLPGSSSHHKLFVQFPEETGDLLSRIVHDPVAIVTALLVVVTFLCNDDQCKRETEAKAKLRGGESKNTAYPERFR